MGTLVAIQYSAQMSNSNDSELLDTTTMMMMHNYSNYFGNSSSPANFLSDVSTAMYDMSAGDDALLGQSTNATDDYTTTFATDTAPYPVGGCITAPVLGEFFEQYYHYIHNVRFKVQCHFDKNFQFFNF